MAFSTDDPLFSKGSQIAASAFPMDQVYTATRPQNMDVPCVHPDIFLETVNDAGGCRWSSIGGSASAVFHVRRTLVDTLMKWDARRVATKITKDDSTLILSGVPFEDAKMLASMVSAREEANLILRATEDLASVSIRARVRFAVPPEHRQGQLWFKFASDYMEIDDPFDDDQKVNLTFQLLRFDVLDRKGDAMKAQTADAAPKPATQFKKQMMTMDELEAQANAESTVWKMELKNKGYKSVPEHPPKHPHVALPSPSTHSPTPQQHEASVRQAKQWEKERQGVGEVKEAQKDTGRKINFDI